MTLQIRPVAEENQAQQRDDDEGRDGHHEEAVDVVERCMALRRARDGRQIDEAQSAHPRAALPAVPQPQHLREIGNDLRGHTFTRQRNDERQDHTCACVRTPHPRKYVPDTT